MIAALLSAVTSRLAGPLALAGCAILGVILIGAKIETARVKADLRAQVAESKRLAADLTTCRGNVAALDGALTRQNAAVAALKASGDHMARKAEIAASEARKAQGEADKLARSLARFRSADTCEAREANVRELVGA
jgi:hypothetical protein